MCWDCVSPSLFFLVCCCLMLLLLLLLLLSCLEVSLWRDASSRVLALLCLTHVHHLGLLLAPLHWCPFLLSFYPSIALPLHVCVCVCMYVACVCVCMHEYISGWIFMCVCVCVSMDGCIWMCVSVSERACVCVPFSSNSYFLSWWDGHPHPYWVAHSPPLALALLFMDALVSCACSYCVC